MSIEITKDLAVSPEAFYDFMIESMLEQIRNDLELDLSPEDLSCGYTHKIKSTDRKNRTETIRFTVRKATRPELFQVVYSSAMRKTGVTYKFEPSEKGCKFTYIHNVKYSDPAKAPKGIKARIEELQARTRLTTMIGQAEADCKKRMKAAAKDNKDSK